jgi:hypothetical protein
MAGRFRRWAFRFTTAFLAFVFCIPSLALTDLVVGLLPAGSGSPSERPANMGDLGYGVIGVIFIAVAFASQVRQPERKVAPLQHIVVVILALAVSAVVSRAYIGVAGAAVLLIPLVVVVSLHPTPRNVVKPRARPSRLLFFLALGISMPSTVYAWAMAANGRANLPPENSFAYVPSLWSAVTAMALATTLVAFHASLRLPGWRISAACVAVATFLFGSASIINSNIPASSGKGWGVAAIIWSLAWAASTWRESAKPQCRHSPLRHST